MFLEYLEENRVIDRVEGAAQVEQDQDTGMPAGPPRYILRTIRLWTSITAVSVEWCARSAVVVTVVYAVVVSVVYAFVVSVVIECLIQIQFIMLTIYL